MSEEEKDILARFTAIELILGFLLARHFRGLPIEHTAAVKASFLGHPHNLAVGMMDATTLQDIAQRIEASLARLVQNASEMENEWRSQAGEL